jgi:glycosyltransferase involved in cell wall biosynthesis
MPRLLRIAQVAPPLERVPPEGYGGTERIVAELVAELRARGHAVTVFASADSSIGGPRVETIPRAMRPAGITADPGPWFASTIHDVLARIGDFDLVHAHLEAYGLLLAAAAPVPVVTTFHGRLDDPALRGMLSHSAGHLVSISRSQAATHPDAPWSGIIHNGLTYGDPAPDARRADGLCFVGRVAQEKGIVDAIEIARLSGRHLRIAAKVGTQPAERAFNEDVFRPALARAGSLVEYVGEVTGRDRDRLFAESFATLMPGSWPEPFGLVTIESLACGTPVIARRVGALPEILRDGLDGFFGDDARAMAFRIDLVGGLDRAEIALSVRERFSAHRMTDAYEALYRRILDGQAEAAPAPPRAQQPIPIVPGPGRPVMRPRPQRVGSVAHRDEPDHDEIR